MARKLKVFQAHLGFFETVVAVPSQAAALEAWGTRQNLFADGGARVATDPAAIAAALASPGVPLRRAVGSDDAFGLDPKLPHLPDAPASAHRPARKVAAPAGPAAARPSRTAPPARARPQPPPPPPRRDALDAAEAALRDVARQWQAQQADFAERRAALEAEIREAERHYAKAQAAATATLRREEAAYAKAQARAGRAR